MAAEPAHRPVLDASALLAYLHGEPGAALVRGLIARARISALNWSEVLQKLLARGIDIEGVSDDLSEIGLDIVPFTAEDGAAAASLWRRARNLSLADRACLSLAARLSVPAVTADRAWSELDIAVDVRLIR